MLWGAASPCSLGPGLQEIPDGMVNRHLNQALRKLLAALESANNEEGTEVDGVDAKGRGGKSKPVRHQLHRGPTPTQQARWQAVQLAREQGLSLRAITRNLGMAENTTKKYAVAESPLTKKLSATDRAKAEALADLTTAAD